MSGTSFEFSGNRSGWAFTPFRTVSTVAPGQKHRHEYLSQLYQLMITEPRHLTERHTDESVCEADGLGGNGHPETAPIRRDDGWLADEAVHWVDELSRVALVVLAGHVGDVIRADGSSLPLLQDTSMQIAWKLSVSCYGYTWCFPAAFSLIFSSRGGDKPSCENIWFLFTMRINQNKIWKLSVCIVAGILNEVWWKYRHNICKELVKTKS